MRFRVPSGPDQAEPDRVVQIVDLGLACCALEVESAMRLGLLQPAEGEPVDCHVLLVAGTVTTALSEAVSAAWQQVPEPKAVVSFGACSDSGGPYWDAPTVVPGLSNLIEVDVFVPGCPPGPTALVQALQALVRSG